MPRFPAVSSRPRVPPAPRRTLPSGAAREHAPIKTQSVRTSLIDAEWDWIARRMVAHDGNWRLASVVHPSFAVVSYAQAKTLTWPALPVARLPLPPDEARTSSPAPTSQNEPEPNLTPAQLEAHRLLSGRMRVLALLAAAALGLLLGAALPRVLLTTQPVDALDDARPTELATALAASAPASVAPAPSGTFTANAPVTVPAEVVTASQRSAPAAPGARPTKKRGPRRGVIPLRSAQRRSDGSDNPY